MIDTSNIDRRLEKRLNFTQGVIVFLLVVVLAVPIVGSWWIARQLPVVNTVSMDSIQIRGETALCPGDTLVVGYNFHAKGSGVLVRDATLWSLEPPKTIIYSNSRRFILDGPIDQHLVEAWRIPTTYSNPETDRPEPLPPGNYRRYMAVSSPSRSTVIAIGYVDFVIREDCN